MNVRHIAVGCLALLLGGGAWGTLQRVARSEALPDAGDVSGLSSDALAAQGARLPSGDRIPPGARRRDESRPLSIHTASLRGRVPQSRAWSGAREVQASWGINDDPWDVPPGPTRLQQPGEDPDGSSSSRALGSLPVHPQRKQVARYELYGMAAPGVCVVRGLRLARDTRDRSIFDVQEGAFHPARGWVEAITARIRTETNARAKFIEESGGLPSVLFSSDLLRTFESKEDRRRVAAILDEADRRHSGLVPLRAAWFNKDGEPEGQLVLHVPWWEEARGVRGGVTVADGVSAWSQRGSRLRDTWMPNQEWGFGLSAARRTAESGDGIYISMDWCPEPPQFTRAWVTDENGEQLDSHCEVATATVWSWVGTVSDSPRTSQVIEFGDGRRVELQVGYPLEGRPSWRRRWIRVPSAGGECELEPACPPVAYAIRLVGSRSGHVGAAVLTFDGGGDGCDVQLRAPVSPLYDSETVDGSRPGDLAPWGAHALRAGLHAEGGQPVGVDIELTMGEPDGTSRNLQLRDRGATTCSGVASVRVPRAHYAVVERWVPLTRGRVGNLTFAADLGQGGETFTLTLTPRPWPEGVPRSTR